MQWFCGFKTRFILLRSPEADETINLKIQTQLKEQSREPCLKCSVQYKNSSRTSDLVQLYGLASQPLKYLLS